MFVHVLRDIHFHFLTSAFLMSVNYTRYHFVLYNTYSILSHLYIVRHVHKMYERCTHNSVSTYVTIRACSTRGWTTCPRNSSRSRERRRCKLLTKVINYHHNYFNHCRYTYARTRIHTSLSAPIFFLHLTRSRILTFLS